MRFKKYVLKDSQYRVEYYIFEALCLPVSFSGVSGGVMIGYISGVLSTFWFPGIIPIWWGIFSSWIFFTCLLRSPTVVKDFGQISQWIFFSPWHIWCNIFSIYSPEQIHSITKKVFYGCCVDASSLTSNDITDFKDRRIRITPPITVYIFFSTPSWVSFSL